VIGTDPLAVHQEQVTRAPASGTHQARVNGAPPMLAPVEISELLHVSPPDQVDDDYEAHDHYGQNHPPAHHASLLGNTH
jgi:hypothetical protein